MRGSGEAVCVVRRVESGGILIMEYRMIGAVLIVAEAV